MKKIIKKTNQKVNPPYVTWNAFIKAIKGFRSNGLPQKIDTSQDLGGFTQPVQSSLIRSFRYLNLVDSNLNASDLFNDLINATKEDELKEVYTKIIKQSYLFLFNNFALAKANRQTVQQQFEKQGLSKTSANFAVLFFCKMAQFSDINLTLTKEKIIRKAKSSGVKNKIKRVSSRVNRKVATKLVPKTKSVVITKSSNITIESKKFHIPIGNGVKDAELLIPAGLDNQQYLKALNAIEFYIGSFLKKYY